MEAVKAQNWAIEPQEKNDNNSIVYIFVCLLMYLLNSANANHKVSTSREGTNTYTQKKKNKAMCIIQLVQSCQL
jgi:hypothetical protein